MGILISCKSISKTYNARPLFSDLSFGIEDDQRIGLIGPNGAGKSTLLKILAGLEEPDQGELACRRKLRVVYMPQEDVFDLSKDASQIVQESAEQVEFVEHERQAAVDSILAKMDFPQTNVANFSGGWRKRLSFACALAKKPELLLLDEPTNHLDLKGILWLESFLKSCDFSFILVSHDRVFLENTTNRMIEINGTYPNGFLSVSGNYSKFLLSREEQFTAQQNLQKGLASKARREIAWLQQGAKARQSKSRERTAKAEKLMEELSEVKGRNALINSQIDISFDSSGRKSKELVVIKGLTKSFGKQTLFKNLDMILTPVSRLGLVGANGSGKSTFIKLVTGEIMPDKGTIVRADGLKIVYFDQNRETLDLSLTLAQALSPKGDSFTYRGKYMHVSTWAKKFLFSSDQLHSTINYLSGGEHARIQIANLMRQTADVLILDEPTNDLDITSLEVLEESLVDFFGAVIIVSHDRMLLSSVTNTILAFSGEGAFRFYADYEQFDQMTQVDFVSRKTKSTLGQEKSAVSKKDRTGLSTNEKRELTEISKTIEKVENTLLQIENEMVQPDIASDYEKLKTLTEKHSQTKEQIENLYKRWEYLESK